MCLDKVDKEIKVKTRRGYKIFGGNTYYIQPLIQTAGVPYPKDEWISDSRVMDISGLSPVYIKGHYPTVSYPAGFHIFLTMVSLERWRDIAGWHSCPVYRVEFDEVVASGTQEGARMVVARKMKIGREVRCKA